MAQREIKARDEEIAFQEKVLFQALEEIKELKRWIDKQIPQILYESVACPICHELTEDAYMRHVQPHKDGCPWRVATRSSYGPQMTKHPY